jgi:hypothetical protein
MNVMSAALRPTRTRRAGPYVPRCLHRVPPTSRQGAAAAPAARALRAAGRKAELEELSHG